MHDYIEFHAWSDEKNDKLPAFDGTEPASIVRLESFSDKVKYLKDFASALCSELDQHMLHTIDSHNNKEEVSLEKFQPDEWIKRMAEKTDCYNHHPIQTLDLTIASKTILDTLWEPKEIVTTTRPTFDNITQ